MPGGIHPPTEVLLQWAKIGNPLQPAETRDWGLVALIIVLFAFTLATVCARLWARSVLQRNFGLDDGVIIASMIPLTGLAVAECLASRRYGFNRHAYDLTPAMAVNSRKITMVIEALYIATTGLTKISILLFYRRLGSGAVSTTFRYAVRSCIAFVICYMITFLLTLFLGCRPITSFWKQVDITWATSHKEGIDYHCFSERSNLLAASAISIVQDFIACGMPTLLFWKLQMPLRQKIALGAIFGVGFFLCITGVLRIIYIYNIFFNTYDVTWACESVWAWTAIEAHIAVICASAPALKAFFRQYLNVSMLSNSLQNSWRNREYSRKGYAVNKDHQGFGTNSSATKSGESEGPLANHGKDVELGHIAVTREVDIDSESRRPTTGETFLNSENSSSDGLQGSHIRQPSKTEAPWLDLDPPSGEPERNIGHSWR